MIKFCNKCGETKLKSDFYKDNSKHDGLKHLCKDCDKEARVRNYRKTGRKDCGFRKIKK